MAYNARRSRLLGRGGTYLGVVALAAFVLGPVVWLVTTSLKPRSEVFASPPRLLPSHLTFQNYGDVLTSDTLQFFVNSVIVCLGTTVMCVLLSLLACYTLTRTGSRGRKPILIGVLASQLLPQAVLLVPLYKAADTMGLLNSRFGLMVAYLTFTLPVAIWLLRGFLMAIPFDLEEAARIDGLSEFAAYWRVIVPLSRPGIAAVAIYVFFMAWQDFMYALVFLTDDSKRTLPLGVLSLIGSHTIEWGQLMAVSTLLLIPILLVFSFAQRYFIAGITAGAVKG
ncbi:carbohydrate ABC transporter permease [Terrabacter terrigena]|uniref:Carbohydrate ABC transporter permease n=1 Tax=Terrabacter terrigena TaxID=574718 RepID=A0ABW3MS33_9MICO